MSFISAFDVMGPNMIGPSSSHTAGAARIAFLARKMLNSTLKKVQFTLYGSFAKTYHGHGTDRALLGGIMGFGTDDMRIRNSFEIAKDIGLDFSFVPNENPGVPFSTMNAEISFIILPRFSTLPVTAMMI